MSGRGQFQPVWHLFRSSVADPEQAQRWAEPFGTDLRAAWRDCPRPAWMLRIAAASRIEPRLYVRAGLAAAERALALVPEARERVGEDLRVIEAWARGQVDDETAWAAMQHAGRQASACAGRASDPPGPARDQRRARSLAMRAVERAAQTALGPIPSAYTWPTAADLARSVARLREADLVAHDLQGVQTIVALVPESAILEGVPPPPKAVVEPCYVEVQITDPEAWSALVALWAAVVRHKADDTLDSDAEIWVALAPEDRLGEVRDAIANIETAEYEAWSALRVDDHTGRLRFEPLAYPYGGTGPIRWLAEAFGLEVVAQDDGTGRRELA